MHISANDVHTCRMTSSGPNRFVCEVTIEGQLDLEERSNVMIELLYTYKPICYVVLTRL